MSERITTWRQFKRKVRDRGLPFLANLDRYPGAILVAGCQRSGTTALTRVITAADEIVDFRRTGDEELDGARILAGMSEGPAGRRCCFQTTYLNERYPEYFEHDGFRLVWVLRNPFSVVYSLVYHWKRFALNELFEGCGAALMDPRERRRLERFGRWSVHPLRRACLSYNAKTSQIFRMVERLPAHRLRVISYDSLIRDREVVLPDLFAFLDLRYEPRFGAGIHSRSAAKQNRLSSREMALIEAACTPVYEQAMSLAGSLYGTRGLPPATPVAREQAGRILP